MVENKVNEKKKEREMKFLHMVTMNVLLLGL